MGRTYSCQDAPPLSDDLNQPLVLRRLISNNQREDLYYPELGLVVLSAAAAPYQDLPAFGSMG